MINTLAGAFTRIRAAAGALAAAALLALTGCTGASAGKAPTGKDVANRGGEAVDTTFDKVTDWSTSYPKLIAGGIVFLVVAYVLKQLSGNKTFAVVAAFIVGGVVVYFSTR
jgi:hypothetical protein